MNFKDIDINNYDYDLPSGRIAQYPLAERDTSKLLILKGNEISQDVFQNIDQYLPDRSLLVFNNSKVIKARLLFRKDSGAAIEILCLGPLSPAQYDVSLASYGPVEWKCIVGNLKKWKSGTLSIDYNVAGQKDSLRAERMNPEGGDAWRIRFSWDHKISFSEVIEATGHVPLPPYIGRGDEPSDVNSYQTVYSKIAGSVAAPTAGLHFTPSTLDKLNARNIKTAEITLHVGAGTFQPVKSKLISGHEMHSEYFSISAATLEIITGSIGRIIPVGTTSVRTLESLYWLGVKVMEGNMTPQTVFNIGQWEAYENHTDVAVETSMNYLLKFMQTNNLLFLHVSTSIIIIPGYKFRLTDGLVTNFHQPRSTLLLLISAFTGEQWKNVYDYAMKNEFRFLSYGDSSLLLK